MAAGPILGGQVTLASSSRCLRTRSSSAMNKHGRLDAELRSELRPDNGLAN